MAHVTVADRRATKAEIVAHAGALRDKASHLGLTGISVQSDGTVVVHSDEPGYRSVLKLSRFASDLVGTYVHVITDDVPGAAGASKL